jgi:hypothetical protein
LPHFEALSETCSMKVSNEFGVVIELEMFQAAQVGERSIV